MSRDDGELLRCAREGDDEAFGRLVEPSLDPAYRLALRILGDPAEAEDAVQEALVKAWRGLSRFRGEARFSTWLYRIVWRESLDRSRARRPGALVADLADPSGEQEPEDRWERMETRRELEEALRRLPGAQRAVVALFYIEDMPLREIAEVLEAPIGTVKTQLHRARRSLRKALATEHAQTWQEVEP